MADERIGLTLDLGSSIDTAKSLAEAMKSVGVTAADLKDALAQLTAIEDAADAAAKRLADSGLAKLAQEEADAATEAKRLADALNQLAQEESEAATAAKRLEDEQLRLANEAMDKVTRAAIEQTQAQRAMNQILEESTTQTSTAAVGLVQTEKAARGAGQGVLSASYAVQDFTSVLANGGGLARALGSVQNNIPALLAGLGAGAGLAGVLSLASVAVGVLVDNWDKLFGVWDEGGTERETSRQDKLKKSVEETKKAIDNQIDALRKAEKAGNPESADIAKAAIMQAGGVDTAVEAVHRQLQGESPEIAEARKKRDEAEAAALDFKAKGGGFYTEQGVRTRGAVLAANRGLGEAEQNVEGSAKELVTKAAQGDEAAIRELNKRFPGEAFGQALPENIRASNDEVDAEAARDEKLSKGSAKRRAGNAMSGDLTRQGQEFEAFGANADKEAEDKADSKAREVFDKAHEGAMKAGDKFQEFADKQEPKLAQVRERAGLGNEFRQFAQDQGADPTKTQVAEAAKSIQDMMAHGIDKDTAAIQALQQVVNNQMRMSGEMAAQKAQLRNIHQQARTVGANMNRNRPG